MKLALATGPYKSVYSETFIKAQVDLLPTTLRIFGTPVPFETDPGGSIHISKLTTGYISNAARRVLQYRQRRPLAFYELKRRLRKYKVNALLANYGVTGASLLPVCKELGINLFVHFHGFDAHQQSVLDAYHEDYRLLGRHAKGIIAVSRSMVNNLILIGIPEDKIHLVRYGADQQLFRPKDLAPKEPVFLSVGRFVDKKAPYLTLLAFSHALRTVPEAKLIMVGDGELIEATRNLAIVLGILDSVEFKGVLAPSEVAELMSSSSVFVQHSLSPLCGPSVGDCEGTPVAIIEAQMSSLPVISTYHAGIQDIIIDGETGFLVSERDTHLMAERMVLLAMDTDLRNEMGRKAREKAIKELRIDGYIKRLSNIISGAKGA